MSRVPPRGGHLCVGRDALAAAVLRSAADAGCVLLFGSRQSGKTTLLRKIQSDVLLQSPSPEGRFTLPVFVDLMTLPYDAKPGDFFELVERLTTTLAAERIPELQG